MRIELDKLSKRYDREWIVRNFSYTFAEGGCYGISGRNGSGKSTLLKMLSGHLSPSRGSVRFSGGGKTIPVNELYSSVSFVGPYIDLIEEMKLEEAIRFHFRFKPLRPGLELQQLPELMELGRQRARPIQQFSSGMKQRVALGLAIYSDTPLLLLDEPTTTLDRVAQGWFQDQLRQQRDRERLVIIATNDPEDLVQSQAVIEMSDVKQAT